MTVCLSSLPETFSLHESHCVSTVMLACPWVTPHLSPKSKFHIGKLPLSQFSPWRLHFNKLFPLSLPLSHSSSLLSPEVPLTWIVTTRLIKQLNKFTHQQECPTWGGTYPFQTLPEESKFPSMWKESILYLFGLLANSMGSLGELERRWQF